MDVAPDMRTLIFKTVEELQTKIDEYFDWCDNRTKRIWDDKEQKEMLILDPAPYTMSGLARRLEVDRKTIVNYSHKEPYFPTIRAARERVHEDVETRLMSTRNEKGATFSLKNNFGWKDESKVENTVILPKPIADINVPSDNSISEDTITNQES